MEQDRRNQAAIVITSIVRLLREFNFGLEVYKDGSLVLTDTKSKGGYKIKIEDLQNIYDAE